MPADKNSLARGRTQKIFQFLRAFNEKKNPIPTQINEHPLRLYWRALPDDEAVRIARREDLPLEDREDENGQGTGDDDFLFKVRRVPDPPLPEPPTELLGWLEPGWDNPRRELTHADERVAPDGKTEVFDESASRVEAFGRWRRIWQEWAKSAQAADQVNDVFDWLFGVRTEMQRESERFELILGDGIFNLGLSSGGVSYPLLLQRVQLDFDSSIPEFTVSESDRPPEINSALLRRANVSPSAIANTMELAGERRVSPLGDERTSEFFRDVVQRFSPDGEFVGEGSPEGERRYPRIGRDPVIFVRTRAQGFEAAITAILDDLESTEEIPDWLQRIGGVHPPLRDIIEEDGTWGQGDEANDVLLSKEANAEQLEIARRLGRYGAVRVQGPPGTGKTHTIANLLGHLLAQGNSVLVTSHTTKALRVLREKVVPELQPLCVSVLEGDAESRAQLADSVNKISVRLSQSSEEQLNREAEELQRERNAKLERLAPLRAKLLDAVSAEYADLVLDGQAFSPTEAGELIAEGVGAHDWLPSPVSDSLPLSEAEVEDLYRTNEEVGAGDEGLLDEGLPEPSTLPSPDMVSTWFVRLHDIEKAGLIADSTELWAAVARSPQDLEDLAARFVALGNQLLGLSTWRLAATAAGAAGPTESQGWAQLADALEQAARAAGDARRAKEQFGAGVAINWSPEEVLKTVGEVRSHVVAGKSLSSLVLVTHPRWKKLLTHCSAIGAPPWTAEHLDALAAAPASELAWREVSQRWPLLMGQYDEAPPASGQGADEILAAACATEIRSALATLEERVDPLIEAAAGLGLDAASIFPSLHAPVPNAQMWRDFAALLVERLPVIFAAEAARLETRDITSRLDSVRSSLSELPGASMPDSPIYRLHRALRELDAAEYGSAYHRLAEIYSRSSALSKRREYLLRLSARAPEWAQAIRLRTGCGAGSVPPGDVRRAWEWRALRDALMVRSAINIDQVMHDIAQIKSELRAITGELIDRRAWASQIRNTTPEQQQKLSLWLATIKKIGKGTGKNVPRLRRAAQEHMASAQGAVPVWIAPLSRVAENFHADSSKFDVVIIDEASQCDVLGLVALYLGKQVIVVGDDQQVTPDAVGEAIDSANQLIDSMLQGIPGKELYDGQFSIYEIAGTAFTGSTRLKEHFRCVPDIIRFSNSLSYNWEIVPLREAASARVAPAVVSHRVGDGGGRDGKENQAEALEVASLMAAACEQPEYDGLTFGMISLVGNEQARLVETYLRNHLSLADFEKRRILCGTSAQFQGDERDVIFLSLVDVPPPNPPLPLRGAGPREMYQKRYNVATSRARDQLWVVHSLDQHRDLKPEDLRWRLLDFARNPSTLKSAIEQAQARADSPLEKGVLQHLVTSGYKVTPQFEVGGYRIDMVVGEEHNRLAIECDGDRFHTQENLRYDLERQAQLERMGWRFIRIRGSEYFRSPDTAMVRVFARLQELGIEPTGGGAAEGGQNETELLERVKRRAAELRNSWRTGARPGSSTSGDTFQSPGTANVQPFSPAATPHSSVPDTPAKDPEPADSGADVLPETDLEVPVSGSEGTSARPKREHRDEGTVFTLPGLDAAEASNDDVRLINWFRTEGYRVEDKRSKGGALWVYGDGPRLRMLMRDLRAKGVVFTFVEKKRAWFTR